jgi:hypothetical protein
MQPGPAGTAALGVSVHRACRAKLTRLMYCPVTGVLSVASSVRTRPAFLLCRASVPSQHTLAQRL